jgi:hypothetical protein
MYLRRLPIPFSPSIPEFGCEFAIARRHISME